MYIRSHSKSGIVIASNKEFVRMSLRFKPGKKTLSSSCFVPDMDKDVAVWDRRLRVVDVRDANDMDFVQPVFKLDWRSVGRERVEETP